MGRLRTRPLPSLVVTRIEEPPDSGRFRRHVETDWQARRVVRGVSDPVRFTARARGRGPVSMAAEGAAARRARVARELDARLAGEVS